MQHGFTGCSQSREVGKYSLVRPTCTDRFLLVNDCVGVTRWLMSKWSKCKKNCKYRGETMFNLKRLSCPVVQGLALAAFVGPGFSQAGTYVSGVTIQSVNLYAGLPHKGPILSFRRRCLPVRKGARTPRQMNSGLICPRQYSLTEKPYMRPFWRLFWQVGK